MKKPTQTLDVIAATQGKDELIVPGELVDIHFPAGAGLSLRAAKAWVAMMELAGLQIVEDVEHSAPLREVVPGGHRGLDDLEAIVQELHQTTISLTYVDRQGLRRRKSTVLVADIDRPLDTDAAEIRWRYSNGVRGLVRHSKHWAGISARAVYAMECKYSPWLYQLVALHAGRKNVVRDWSLEELRVRLGATAQSLGRWADFRRWALEPAVAEINQLTGVRLSWAPIKRGRSVTGVRITCVRKETADLAEADTELHRTRDGRAARRAGKVEHIVGLEDRLRASLEAADEAAYKASLGPDQDTLL